MSVKHDSEQSSRAAEGKKRLSWVTPVLDELQPGTRRYEAAKAALFGSRSHE
jgi:hypothetical protein